MTFTVIGGTNATIEFGTGTLMLPQVEPGTIATLFEYRIPDAELRLNQRYLPAIRANGVSNKVIGAASSFSTILAYAPIGFPVQTRVPVTGMVVSANDAIGFTASWSNTTAISAGQYSDTGALLALSFTGASGGYLSNPIYFTHTTDYILFTGAEL